MKFTKTLLLVLLLLPTFLSAGERVHSIAATANLPFATVLPGVPFDVTVSVKNTSNESVSVGLLVRLLVTLPDGTLFRSKDAELLGPRSGSSLHPDKSVELAPGESRDLALTWSYATIPNWSHFGEFSAPGEYSVRLELVAAKPADNYVGTVTTNSVLLHRAVAAGEDTALWNRMLQMSGGRWADDSLCNSKEGRVLLKEILDVHPASSYYPYALLMAPVIDSRQPSSEDIDRVRDAAARFHNSPAYPYLVFRTAEIADSIAQHAEWSHDHKTALQFSALAEQYYQEVGNRVTNPVLLQAARSARERAHERLESRTR